MNDRKRKVGSYIYLACTRGRAGGVSGTENIHSTPTHPPFRPHTHTHRPTSTLSFKNLSGGKNVVPFGLSKQGPSHWTRQCSTTNVINGLDSLLIYCGSNNRPPRHTAGGIIWEIETLQTSPFFVLQSFIIFVACVSKVVV